MFAVTGWSVSASQLKTQQEPATNITVNAPQYNGGPAPAEQKSKKRKRDRGKSKGTEVTEDNVVELWQKHIEGRDPVKQVPENQKLEKRERKRKRKEKSENGENGPGERTTEPAEEEIHDRILASDPQQKSLSPSENQHEAPTAPTTLPKDGKAKYDQRKAKALEKAQRRKSQPRPPQQPSEAPPIATPNPPPSTIPPASTTTAPKPPPPPPPQPTPKLTPLQTAMRAKLISARFRHLNQTLYTTPSSHASSLFSSDPKAYDSYHMGFRAQVASWPQNPVEIFIRDVRMRGAVGGAREKGMSKRKGKGGKERGKGGIADGTDIINGDGNVKLDPLPRSGKKSTILDLGCGDAHLHATLSPHAPSLNLSMHSFDLSPGSGPNAHLVTVADIARLPVADASADVAIFCLALMGTNWVDFVAEAARVVRVGGECWVGEVKSRFAGAQEISKVTAGDKKKSTKKKKKRKGDMDEDEDGEELGRLQVEEETSMANGKQGASKDKETDVGPFLGVFERRGFVLKGEVDMGNKMFVRMRFVRVRDVVKGGKRKDGATKYIDSDGGEAVDKEVEAKILKPCVYKTR